MGAGVKGWIKGVFEFQSVLCLAWKMWAEHATGILLNLNKSFEIDCLFCVGRMALKVVIPILRQPISRVSRSTEKPNSRIYRITCTLITYYIVVV